MKKRKSPGKSRGAGPGRVASGRRGRGQVKFTGGTPRVFSGGSFENRSVGDVWDRAFDDAADMIVLLDSDFRIIKANGAFATTSGRGPEDLIGRKCREIVGGTAEPNLASLDPKALLAADAVVEMFYVARIGSRFLLSVPRAAVDPERLLYCIRVAMEIARPEIGGRGPMIGDEQGRGRIHEEDRLTPRQHEILRLLCQGLLVKEIAFQLKISARTVEFHKRKMMENLGVKTFAELIKYAIRQHIAT